jgi:hypothetical protein
VEDIDTHVLIVKREKLIKRHLEEMSVGEVCFVCVPNFWSFVDCVLDFESSH